MARQRKVEIQEYAVGVHPCDTSNSAFRLRTVKENVGYTLDMTVTGSLGSHQPVVHHWTSKEVVVAGALNSEMCYENVRLLLDIDAHDYKSSLLDIFIY